MSVRFVIMCCVRSGLHCDLIARSEGSYCVCLCNLEISTLRMSKRDLSYCVRERNFPQIYGLILIDLHGVTLQ
jgi:hypothetical protein